MSLKDVFGYQKVRYADGSPVITYDNKGNRLSETDSRNAVTKFTYDQYGNLSSLIDAVGKTASISFSSRICSILSTVSGSR